MCVLDHYWRGALHWGCIETIIQVLNPPFPPPTLVSAWFSLLNALIFNIITTLIKIIITPLHDHQPKHKQRQGGREAGRQGGR